MISFKQFRQVSVSYDKFLKGSGSVTIKININFFFQKLGVEHFFITIFFEK